MNSMEMNLLKSRIFLAKMYRVEKLAFSFREEKLPIHMVSKK